MERRPPDLQGPGHARRLRFETRRLELPDAVYQGPWRAWKPLDLSKYAAEWPAGLDLWFVHAPGAHPMWDWHVMSACSLAAFPGLPPAVLHRPGMSHEFTIAALDPKWEVNVDPTPDDRLGSRMLSPFNMLHQVGGLTDETALELEYLLVRAIVMGHANPDDDFKARNIELIEGTAQHLREGKHLPS